MDLGPSVKLHKANDFFFNDAEFTDHENDVTVFFLYRPKVVMPIADKELVPFLEVHHSRVGKMFDPQNGVSGFDNSLSVEPATAERHAAAKVAVLSAQIRIQNFKSGPVRVTLKINASDDRQ